MEPQPLSKITIVSNYVAAIGNNEPELQADIDAKIAQGFQPMGERFVKKGNSQWVQLMVQP